MNPSCVRKPEQIKLIMECRQSGLSDYQWCRKQGIHPGTFYNWVSKLRKAGYTIPDSESKSCSLPVMQEVVRLDLAEHEVSTPAIPRQNADLPSPTAVSSIATEMECRTVRIRIFNGADPAVQGFLYCNKLFEYERTYREKGLSYKQIYNRRLKDQKSVVEAFVAWIDKQNAPNGSRLARALTYAGNQRPYMMTYLEDGRCSISNN